MYEYAIVYVSYAILEDDEANNCSHVVYTIPVAILLTVVLLPLCTRLDIYKVFFLITVAFTYTIPW